MFQLPLQLLLLLACTEVQPVQGKVVDIWNNPIEGATVIAAGESHETDAYGVFTVPRFTGEAEFKAGKEGYVQAATSMTLAEGDTKGPVFKLYKKPAENGFYAITTGDYRPIAPATVKVIGHDANAIFGISNAKDSAYVEGDKLSIVYKIDFTLAQLKQLGLQLRKLKYVENAEMATIGGGAMTEVPINLYVDDGDVPISIEKLMSKGHFLLETTEPLKPGLYALQSQNLLTPSDEQYWKQIPEALRTVYPIAVRQ